MELLLATKNAHKVEELKHLLKGLNVEVSSLADYPSVQDVVEDGDTFLANARKKATYAAKTLHKWALADDTGLVVEALGGQPGVLSARYAGGQGDYAANNQKLLAELREVPDCRRHAVFVCCMVLFSPDGREWEVEGRLEGRIVRGLKGDRGFGYDPLFFIPGKDKTLAELTMDEKSAISHRGQALEKMRKILVEIIGRCG